MSNFTSVDKVSLSQRNFGNGFQPCLQLSGSFPESFHFPNNYVPHVFPLYYIYDHLGNTRVTYRNLFECIIDEQNGASGSYPTHYVLKHLHDYFPYGKTLREWYASNEETERFQTTHHQRDMETTLDYRGARFYDADVGRFLSLDPLAAEYPALSDYVYVADNPLKYVDPEGKWIESVIKEGAGKNGNDLMVITMTGKLIDFSYNNVDMDKALVDIKAMVESIYQGENIKEGLDVKFEFDFEIAETMSEVSDKDHLIVFAELSEEGALKGSRGGSSDFGGMVSWVDADWFTGWFDYYFGSGGERIVAHEIGHLLHLIHPRKKIRPNNIMIQGRWGTNLDDDQLRAVIRWLEVVNGVNKGANRKNGTPNLGATSKRAKLVNTRGRTLSRKEINKRISDEHKLIRD